MKISRWGCMHHTNIIATGGWMQLLTPPVNRDVVHNRIEWGYGAIFKDKAVHMHVEKCEECEEDDL
jgi:hypothetical protein